MATGNDLLKLAEKHIGEEYGHALVPKDNPNWALQWDCAEFATWVVYQKVGKLYGCTDDNANPAVADAYSGAWVRDVKNGRLLKTDQATANNTAGVILIREPPRPGAMGHIAISDGKGGTVEAANSKDGVKRGVVEGRDWQYCAKIPGVKYVSTGAVVKSKPLPYLLKLEDPNMSGPLVRKVQSALKQAGYDPGKIDGAYGPHTVAAVVAYQTAHRLVPDGVVGPATAKKLGVEWPKAG